MLRQLIFLASDHNGVELKKSIIQNIRSKYGLVRYDCIDLGPYTNTRHVDYIDYAAQLSAVVKQDPLSRGILICGTGVGMSIVANRAYGIRAVLAHNETTAKKSREHNDTNVLCLGAWITNEQETNTIVDAWLTTICGGGRHMPRISRIDPHVGIVLSNGCFDVLHSGHIELLKFAKTQGTHLVVALDSDRRIKELKGQDRPINNQDDRKRLLEAIDFVDEVVIFDTTEELQALYQTVHPQVIVKGEERTVEEIRQRDNIPIEIEIKVFPIVGSYSTTNTLMKIKELETWKKQ